jgi:hypothetical protein
MPSPPDAVFGSADPVAFAFAIVASILASLSLMDQLALAIKRGLILSIVKGMRLIFVPEAVDALHLHGEMWSKLEIQDLLVSHSGLISLMLRHPCGWKPCPDMERAGLAMNDFVNLSCVGILDNFDGRIKTMFLIRWAISSALSWYSWVSKSFQTVCEREFNKELDEWFITTLASCTDMSEEEMIFLEKLACLRMLHWNRPLEDDAQKLAWEVPQQRKYTTLWLLLSLKEVLRTNEKEGYYKIGTSGVWASIDRVGMTLHFRTGRNRLGFWTTYRIWDLEKKAWKEPAGQAELDASPKLLCQNRLTSPIADFGNCVDVGLNALFFMRTDKSLVNNLLNLIETLNSSQGPTHNLSIPDEQLASPVEVHRLGASGVKSWCRCTSSLRVSARYLCCVPVCTIFLRAEAVASIPMLPRRASGQIIYIIISKSSGVYAQTVSIDAPVVKQGHKDIFSCMLTFQGKAIMDVMGASESEKVPYIV